MLSLIFLKRCDKSCFSSCHDPHGVRGAVKLKAYVQSGNHMSMKRDSAECECL